MRRNIEWFANPLPKQHRFMAAYKITKERLKLTDGKLLYALVYMPEDDGLDKSYRYYRQDSVAKNTVPFIRDYFKGIYDDEESCIDYLNKIISNKYFARGNIVTYKQKPKEVRDKTSQDVKDLMDSVFEHLQL